jgi:hypothetical protein
MSIALVQEVSSYTANGGPAGKTITIAAPGAGNALRLMLRRVPTLSISSVTGGGVTWTQLASVTNSNSSMATELWGGDNSSGSGTTITVTVSDTYGGRVDVNVSEWSGMPATRSPSPAPSTNTGTSATLTTSSVTPTASNEVLLLAVGVATNGTVTNTPSGGFTALSRAGVTTFEGFGYRIVPAASGSYSTTWANSVAYWPWATIIAGWDGAGGGGGGAVGMAAVRPLRQRRNKTLLRM